MIPTSTEILKVNNNIYCLGVDVVILSIWHLTDAGWSFNFEKAKAKVVDPNHVIYKSIYRNYCWFLSVVSNEDNINKVTHKPFFNSFLWHCCLGHSNEQVVKKYLEEHFPEQVKNKTWQLFFCEQCAKSTSLNQKSPGANSLIPQDDPLDLLVSDVLGPLVVDMQGNKYMLTLHDHAST